MNETTGKIPSVLKLVCALFLCCLLSLGVYLLAVPFVYGAWHCPPPAVCAAPLWVDLVSLFIFLSPLSIFTFGAYLCRKIIWSLSESKILRAVVFGSFALFPLVVFGGLIIYIILDARQ
jgi:hypothetical protein